MVFHRYASPMVMLDSMIKTRRFSEFVNEFIKIRNEETEDQTKWEYWLHRVVDMSFADFLEKSDNRKNAEISHDVLEATLKDSWGIINGFCPS